MSQDKPPSQPKSILKRRDSFVAGLATSHHRKVSISPKRRVMLFNKDNDDPLSEQALAEAKKNLDLTRANTLAKAAAPKKKRTQRIIATSPKNRKKTLGSRRSSPKNRSGSPKKTKTKTTKKSLSKKRKTKKTTNKSFH